MKVVVPCPQLPPELVKRAEEAERRKDEAVARISEKLGMSNDDEFEHAMRALIDADRRAVLAIGNHRSRR